MNKTGLKFLLQWSRLSHTPTEKGYLMVTHEVREHVGYFFIVILVDMAED